MVSEPKLIITFSIAEIFKDFKAMNGVVMLGHGCIVSLFDLSSCAYD